jgi:hypothetical protein
LGIVACCAEVWYVSGLISDLVVVVVGTVVVAAAAAAAAAAVTKTSTFPSLSSSDFAVNKSTTCVENGG